METLLVIRNIEVENANAIAGLTWGFPAISHFLGFTHALSRKLPKDWSINLEGCGVVCHKHQVSAYQASKWSDYRFALTRNPLTKDGVPTPIVEEGRMHMKVSLLIPCGGELDEEIEKEDIKAKLWELLFFQRLAGGTIKSIGDIEILDVPEEFEEQEKFERKQLRKLLPGFALIQRTSLLAEHSKRTLQQDSNTEPLDAWLDFSALKFKAEAEVDGSAEWNYSPKPGKGWLVPISVGYRAISDLYEAGEVARARDNETPFRFVEQVYSVGEWTSPHRITNFNQLFWHYHAEVESGSYLCCTGEPSKK
jgi:CRISPR-associated protein Csy2